MCPCGHPLPTVSLRLLVLPLLLPSSSDFLRIQRWDRGCQSANQKGWADTEVSTLYSLDL